MEINCYGQPVGSYGGGHGRFNQIRRVMRLTFFLLTAALMHVHAAGRAQNITLNGRSLTLKQIFTAVEKQTGYVFLCPERIIQSAPPVSISAEQVPLDQFLEEVFRAHPSLRYKIRGKSIFVSEVEVAPHAAVPIAVPAADPPFITIVMVVTDSLGTPLSGASVINRNTMQSGSTDRRGKLSVKANIGDVLDITYIGFERTSIIIHDNSSPLLVILKTATSTLDDLQIIAYGQTSRRLLTGSISRVDAKTISQQPVSNVLQAIAGRMPGVQVQQSTGVAGGAFTIQIRGRNSLRAEGNIPFYVVDGVPFTAASLNSVGSYSNILGGNPLVAINPNDIESIEVLKDADATAIYGSRGANGVVLITTKKGRSGKAKLDLVVSQGGGKISNKLKLLNTQQYLDMRYESLRNDNQLPLLDDPNNDPIYPDLKTWDKNAYTDWQKVLLGGTANTTNVQATLSGGNTNTRFTLSSGYYRETSVFPGSSSLERPSARFSMSHTSDDQRWGVELSVSYSATKNTLPQLDFTAKAVKLPPNAPRVYDSTGGLSWDWKSLQWSNPLIDLEKKYTGHTDNLIANTQIRYTLLKGLDVRLNAGFTKMDVKEHSISPLSAISPAYRNLLTANAIFNNASVKTWILEPQLTWQKALGGGQLNMLVGTTFQNSLQQGSSIYADGYTSDALLDNIQAATSFYIFDASYAQYRYNGFFGRINYNYDQRYIINLTGRRDGSSRFGPGRQFASFGSVGAAWLFTNEKFAKDWEVLTFGKLRASFGSTGSDNIGNYQFLSSYRPTYYPYLGTTGLIPSRLANPDYSWEANKKLELAIELGFLKDRVLFSAGRYQNRSSSQLIGFPLPVLTGQSSVQMNFPATVENKGWEFELTTLNIKGKNFQWRTSANLSIPKNVLLRFDNLSSYPDYVDRYEVGKSLFIQKTFVFKGVDPQTGLYTYEDFDKDGVIDYGTDRRFTKEIAQKFYGGLSNSLSYHGLQIDIFFQFVKQTARNFMYAWEVPGSLSNQPKIVLDRWQKPGDVTGIQQFGQGKAYSAYSNINFSDRVISDASFIRLKNVSVSYTLPEKWFRRAHIGAARLFVQGQNLLTITKYLGMDPETQNVDALPPLRMVTGGFQITF